MEGREAKFDHGHQAPEVAPQNYPEVAAEQHQQLPYQSQAYYAPKPEAQSPYTPLGGSTAYSGQSPYAQHALPVEEEPHRAAEATFCGCSLLVFILSCIIAILSAAVIGLAAGTGVEANRANDATTQLASVSSALAAATKTGSGANPTATSFNALDNGCSDNPSGVSNSSYTPFSLLGKTKFTMFCNLDTPLNPIMSLFVSDFNGCMDACAGYTHYVPKNFANATNRVNTTCEAVSFIPLWTNKSSSLQGGAPGNCYLKPGPQNVSALYEHDIGTEVHSAVLTRNGTNGTSS